MPDISQVNTIGLSDRTKGILTGIVSTAIIASGLVVGFQGKDKPKMTYDEAQMLIKVYNYELSKAPSKQFQNITKDNVVQKLQDKFSQRIPTTNATIDKEILTPDTYKILRSGLFQKAQ